jgi:ABC-2 type transport system permease protein
MSEPTAAAVHRPTVAPEATAPRPAATDHVRTVAPEAATDHVPTVAPRATAFRAAADPPAAGDGGAAAGPVTAFLMLVRWQLASLGTTMLPVIVVVQALLAIGIVVGFGLLIPSIDPATALFLSTGAPTVLLMTVGLVIVPQAVATARANGSFAYLRSLPVARPLLLASDLTVWSAVALPGIVGAVAAAKWHYDLTFSFDWPLLVAASVLIVVTSTAVGFAIAVALPQALAMVLSQVLVFFVLLFSPITYPVSQLPSWFQTVHAYLPMEAAADAMRAGLASGAYAVQARDLLVLALWCAGGIAVSLRALTRRD